MKATAAVIICFFHLWSTADFESVSFERDKKGIFARSSTFNITRT